MKIIQCAVFLAAAVGRSKALDTFGFVNLPSSNSVIRLVSFILLYLLDEDEVARFCFVWTFAFAILLSTLEGGTALGLATKFTSHRYYSVHFFLSFVLLKTFSDKQTIDE